MKTLILKDEQIDIIRHALGIAERKFINLHTKIVQDTISVRGFEEREEGQKEALYYHNTACLIADLNIALKNGDLEEKKIIVKVIKGEDFKDSFILNVSITTIKKEVLKTNMVYIIGTNKIIFEDNDFRELAKTHNIDIDKIIFDIEERNITIDSK